MAELASRIGKRALYGNLTWTRPGLEEEERQKTIPQSISFGNGHSLSSPSKWDGNPMDLDSDASSANEPVESIAVAAPMSTKPPTSRSPKIIRNRMKDSGNNPESPMSLMERLGVGSMAETTGSASASPTERGSRNDAGHRPAGENDALASKPTDHEAASFLPTTSADMATEDLVIPGLTIAQRAGSMANGRHAQEATPNKEVTGHSPELINNMRRLLVPLIVKKAEQGLSSSDRRSTTTPDLAQQADAIVTTKVCDDFIRQAIASVKDLKDIGKIPNGDHLAIQDKNIGFLTATRSPTPLPPGLGIKTQSWAGISTATVGVPSPPTDPSKPMLPDHPTPSLPRAMRVKRFPRSPSQEGPSRSPTWKGKEKAPFLTSSRPKSPWRRPRSPSPAPRSASAHRRSPFPTNMGSNLDSRPSSPRGRDPYRQTDDWRPRPPSWREPTNYHPADPHRRSPPPSYARDDLRWRGYPRPPPESPPLRTPQYRDRERTRTRSPSPSPGPNPHRLPNNKRKAYSPVRRDGPLRGWSKSPPRRGTPPGPTPKKQKYNASSYEVNPSRSPEARPQESYGSPPQRRTTSGNGSFSSAGYSDKRQRSFSYSRREHSPLERRGFWRDGSPAGQQPPPPSSTASSTFPLTRRVMNSPQPLPPPPWTMPVTGSGPYESSWREQQSRFPRSPPPPPPPRSAGYDASSSLATLPLPKSQPQAVPSLPPRPHSVEERNEILADGTMASVYTYFDPAKGERVTLTKVEEPQITVDWDAVGYDGQTYDNPIELDYGSSSRGTTVARMMSVDGRRQRIEQEDEAMAMEVDNQEFDPPGLSFTLATSQDDLQQPSETAATATKKKKKKGGKSVQENTPKVRPLFEQLMEEEVDRKPDIRELEKSLVPSMNPLPSGDSSSSGLPLSPSQVSPPLLTGLEASLRRRSTPAATVETELPERPSVTPSRVSTPVPVENSTAVTNGQVGRAGGMHSEEVQVQQEEQASAQENEPGEENAEDNAGMQQDSSYVQEGGITAQAQYDEHAQPGVSDANAQPIAEVGLQANGGQEAMQQDQDQPLGKEAQQADNIDIGNAAAEESDAQATVDLSALDNPVEQAPSQEYTDNGSGDMSLETPEPSPELRVPGIWLVQQAPALRVAMTDLTLDIAQETASKWDLGIGNAGSSAGADKPRIKPKVRLQLLCFSNDTLKDVDLSSEESLDTLQQSWPQPGSLIVHLNADAPYQRIWLGHDIPEPTGGSGRGIYMEKYVRVGLNKLRLLQLRDIGEFTFVLVAKPATLKEPDPIDVALAQLQKELIESMENWKESLGGGIRPLVARVEVERLGEDEDDF